MKNNRWITKRSKHVGNSAQAVDKFIVKKGKEGSLDDGSSIGTTNDKDNCNVDITMHKTIPETTYTSKNENDINSTRDKRLGILVAKWFPRSKFNRSKMLTPTLYFTWIINMEQKLGCMCYKV